MRYFIDISYNGTPYFGFQRQPDALSVQEVLEDATAIYFQVPVIIFGAGRTDAGVHAKQMIAHFDCDDAVDKSRFLYKMNKLLPDSVSVNDVYEVNAEAHARFDANARAYEYVVTTKKNPFLAKSALHVIKTLDVDAMNKASEILLEYKDFECFCKVQTEVKTFNCNLEKAEWSRREDQLVFTIMADRFLRNMVRAIVGTLLEVGLHKRTAESIRDILLSKDRSEAGKSVAAKGLYITKVAYPDFVYNINTPIVREFVKI